MCCTREGAMLGPSTTTHILHRLSRRAGFAKRIGPHALRHYAATSLLRRTGDLELVRRVLRHESLAMTLRYAVHTQTEVAAKFLHASPLDHLDEYSGSKRAQSSVGIHRGILSNSDEGLGM
jgi:site-specific recombinase XerD